MNTCTYCHLHDVINGYTLCKNCRILYARTLKTLQILMPLLQSLAHKKYKLNERVNASHAASSTEVINLSLLDTLTEVEELLQDTWLASGQIFFDNWQHLLPRMPVCLPQLCRSQHAAQHLHKLIHACTRIQQLTDRQPRTRTLIGLCPHCGTPITAAANEEYRLCENCKQVFNVHKIKQAAAHKVNTIHKTMTAAQCSRWLHSEFGIEVSRKTISKWLERGKLAYTKKLKDGYYEFNLSELITLAQHSKNV